jgi:catechol 2,3-dioxygenase-like lactoylglutathione lyase family enzyme
MNLPDAPIAHEGFFATHFFTVSDQDKSKDFYVRILGGKLIKPDNPCYIKLANTWIIFSIPAVARLPTSQRSFLKHRRI